MTCSIIHVHVLCVGNHRYVYMYMYMNSERIMGTCTCTSVHILYTCTYLGPSFSMHCIVIVVLWTETFSVGCLYVRVHTIVFRASVHGHLNITSFSLSFSLFSPPSLPLSISLSFSLFSPPSLLLSLSLSFSLTSLSHSLSFSHSLSSHLPPSLSFPLQSAIAKEQELENKLASMQSVINAARELASDSMIVSVPPPGLVSCRVTCVL